jgi:hypothetical protein
MIIWREWYDTQNYELNNLQFWICSITRNKFHVFSKPPVSQKSFHNSTVTRLPSHYEVKISILLEDKQFLNVANIIIVPRFLKIVTS